LFPEVLQKLTESKEQWTVGPDISDAEANGELSYTAYKDVSWNIPVLCVLCMQMKHNLRFVTSTFYPAV
jgi:hypothetical protein